MGISPAVGTRHRLQTAGELSNFSSFQVCGRDKMIQKELKEQSKCAQRAQQTTDLSASHIWLRTLKCKDDFRRLLVVLHPTVISSIINGQIISLKLLGKTEQIFMVNLLAILLVLYLASSKSLTTMYKGTKASCMPVLLSSIHTVCAMCINVLID